MERETWAEEVGNTRVTSRDCTHLGMIQKEIEEIRWWRRITSSMDVQERKGQKLLERREGRGGQWDAGVALLTGDLVQALLGDVVVLVDPLPVAFEVDLGGWVGTAHELHRLVLHDVGVLRLQQEVREGLRRRRGEGVGQHVTVLQPCQGIARHH